MARPYIIVSDLQLSRWLVTARRARRLVTCEFGHDGCGCSTVRAMSGKAPCAKAASDEVQVRSEEQKFECDCCGAMTVNSPCGQEGMVQCEDCLDKATRSHREGV